MGFKVSLGPCLEARVFGNWEGEKGMSEALGGGRGIQWAPSSPRVQPWGHLWDGGEAQVVSRKQRCFEHLSSWLRYVTARGGKLGEWSRGLGAGDSNPIPTGATALARAGLPSPPAHSHPPDPPRPHAAMFMTLCTVGAQRTHGEAPRLCPAPLRLEGSATRGSALAPGPSAGGRVLPPGPTHHSQVPVLGLGDEQLRAGREVDDAIPAGTPCERDAGGKVVREAHLPHARTAPSPPLPASPALVDVDVDVIHAVGAEGCLGQCLNHMVTLQHHVPLGAQTGSGVRPCPELEKHPLPHPVPRGPPSAYCPHAARGAQRGCRSGC